MSSMIGSRLRLLLVRSRSFLLLLEVVMLGLAEGDKGVFASLLVLPLLVVPLLLLTKRPSRFPKKELLDLGWSAMVWYCLLLIAL